MWSVPWLVSGDIVLAEVVHLARRTVSRHYCSTIRAYLPAPATAADVANRWNTLKTYEAILNELGADIICFQETKITKKQVDRSMAILPSYDSFFSSYSRKPEKGYSGTCIFTKRSVCVPAKAEEGISGLLPAERRPAPSQDELIGGAISPDNIALNMQDVKTIDLEGRTTMVDLGLFVLINVYCPNETNEDRLDFKLAFNAMLEARILNLIKLGREVVVLGDMNICSQPIDHCDPVRRANESPYGGFELHPARKWFNEFIGPHGSMVDLGRHFYPDRKSMFTHWETRINARETNYGTRLDYILATPGLLPWIKTCEIQPHVLGSDHCPVIADFHESIVSDNGVLLYLSDQINPPGRQKDAAPPEPPKLAAKFYSEFSSEQRLLSNFFGKGADAGSSASASPKPGTSQPKKAKIAPAAAPASTALLETSATTASGDPATISTSKVQPPSYSPSIDLTLDHTDEEAEADSRLPTRKTSRGEKARTNGNDTKFSKKKTKKGQATLATFFKPPATKDTEISTALDKRKGKAKETSAPRESSADRLSEEEGDRDEDLEALRVQASNGNAIQSGPYRKKRKKSIDSDDDEIQEILRGSFANNEQASTAWSSIFTAKVPPLCTMHGEPCKQWSVNKSGPNKGRVFWLCARPVGEGYERSGQKKSEVNPEYRCNFFKWESDIKRSGSANPTKKRGPTPGGG